MNSEPELVSRTGDDVLCAACGARFDRAGNILQTGPEPVLGPKSKKG